MKYIELSIKELEEQSRKLARIVSDSGNFKPDVVVFIAKGSFIIGYEVSKYFQVPLVECFAEREGNKIKEIVSPLLKFIPKNAKQLLRQKELKSGVHKKKITRNVYITKNVELVKCSTNILIVDDSVDTGYTASEVYQYLKKMNENLNIKFASFNWFIEDSKEVFNVDYFLYLNHIILGPWSKDSREYNKFKTLYFEAKQKGLI